MTTDTRGQLNMCFFGAGAGVHYLRIGSLVSEKAYLNLQEIQVFGPDGELLLPMGAVMSSTFEDNTVNKCFDGDRFTSMQLCATLRKGNGDTDPWLRVDYGEGVIISKIVVTNRVDCCKERINGATISLTNDQDGRNVVWSTTFDGTKAEYTFHLPSFLPSYPPTQLPTDSPTKLLSQPIMPVLQPVPPPYPTSTRESTATLTQRTTHDANNPSTSAQSKSGSVRCDRWWLIYFIWQALLNHIHTL